MFRIKVCGVTRAVDAQVLALAGADAVGLNFYENSPRYIDPEEAGKIVSVLPKRVARVGVFVNRAADEIREIADRLQLDWIQLHGDEPPRIMAELGNRQVVRAFRCGENGVAQIGEYLEACQREARRPDAVLFDAYQPGAYGGTGSVVDWQTLSKACEMLGGLPWVLAGGLTPFNVGEAIAQAMPTAVDVASGVETRPGSKDPLLLRAFVNAARKAFAMLATSK